MKRVEAEDHYRSQGLAVEYGFDKPGKEYTPHQHERTTLRTLGGSAMVRVNDNHWWQRLLPDTEFVIESGQLHEAIVGAEGWEVVAAWDPKEAENYPSVH